MIEEGKSCMFPFRFTFFQKEQVLENLETCPGKVLEFYFAENVRTLTSDIRIIKQYKYNCSAILTITSLSNGVTLKL